MMGRQKQILAVIGGLVVLVLLIGVVYLNSIDFNQYKSQISEQVRAATGRELAIEGDLDLTVSLSPKLAVDSVTFSNAEWGTRKEMVTVKRLVVQVNLLPLLFGDIQVAQLVLEEPDILLETDTRGTGNWVFKAGEESAETDDEEGAPSLPMINNVRIDKARFTYIDGKTGEKSTVVVDTLEASAADMNSPLSLLLQGSLDDKRIELSGTIDSISGLMSGGDVDLDLKLKADERTLVLAGSGSVTGDGSRYNFDTLDIQLDKNRLKGGFELDLSQTPIEITAAVNSDLIDLREALAEKGGEVKADKEPKKEGKEKTKLFPSTPLPVEGLRSVNADVKFTSKKIVGPRYALNDVRISMTLKQGVLKVAPIAMTIGGGQFNSTVTLNGSTLPASLHISVTGKSLNLGKMLVETGVTDLVTGAVTQVDIDLKGRGKSIASLMGSLNGRALVNVDKGKINNKYVNLAGADLVNQLIGALNPLAKKEEFTNLECAVVNLQFKNGTSKYNKRIAIETDKMTVVSSGEINLGKETLDIGIKPKPLKDTMDLGVGAGDLVSAARIHGPLAEPELGLDVFGAAKVGLKVSKAIATGGISLVVGGLFDKAMADAHPCQTALGKKESSSTKPAEKEEGGGFLDGLKKKLGG
jgi:uncharacterized protein involved in outer membrane biogenesis